MLGVSIPDWCICDSRFFQGLSRVMIRPAGWVSRFLNSRGSSRAGSGGLTGRVGQGQEVSPVESGQEVIKYHGSRQVMSGRGRPGPRRVTLPMKCPDIVL